MDVIREGQQSVIFSGLNSLSGKEIKAAIGQV